MCSLHCRLGCFFNTKKSFADKSQPDSHYMAQDQVKDIFDIKIAWKLGMRKVFEKSENLKTAVKP